MQNEIITKRLKEVIQDYFERNNISQKEYADKIKIHPKTLSNYVNGYREMPYEILSKISNDMDIDLNHVFKDKSRTYTLEKNEVNFINLIRDLPFEAREDALTAFETLINIKK